MTNLFNRPNLKTPWICISFAIALVLQTSTLDGVAVADEPASLTIDWNNDILTIHGAFPGERIEVNYLEAYCRPGSTDRVWQDTVVGHKTELIEATPDHRTIQLKCTLRDGVVVEHVITANREDIDFKIRATNPTTVESAAHWAQPCIRLAEFVGVPQKPSSEEYLPKSFLFVEDQLTRLPTRPWATSARYTPGQVWVPKGVDRNDVNPRPLSSIVPSNGLIGCFSSDERWLFATAFEPYQELFQGVIVCLHSDFRIGGLKPGETKQIRGKIYLQANDVPRLLKRYQEDFPEHAREFARPFRR